MLELSKPIVVNIPISRISDGEYTTYYISANGVLVYTGKAIVINSEITIRVDRPLRAYAWHLSLDRRGSQGYAYNLTNGVDDTQGINNLVFTATITSGGGSVSVDCAFSDSSIFRGEANWTDFRPLSYITPRIPKVPTDKLSVVMVNYSIGEFYKVLAGDNGIINSQVEDMVSAGAYKMSDIYPMLEDATKATANVKGASYDIWHFDECPNMARYYVTWFTPEGGWCCWPFNGSCITTSNIERVDVTGFDGRRRVVAEEDRVSFELHSDVLPNEYYNEILFGITRSPICGVYDVINDKMVYCISQVSQCASRPSKSTRMESVSVVLESISKEVVR